MKKLKLDQLQLGELLTREQMKNVVGGDYFTKCYYECVHGSYNVGTSCPSSPPPAACTGVGDGGLVTPHQCDCNP